VSQWEEWLEDPYAEREILVEAVSYYAGAEHTHRLSTRGYKTAAGDPDGRQYYAPRLTGEPEIEHSIPATRAGGAAVSGWGDLEFANGDGGLDAWPYHAWDGRRLVVRFGAPAWEYADFRIILDGVVSHCEVVDDNKLRLHVRDRRYLLDGKVQSELIKSGPQAGRPIPLCYGEVYNLSPAPIDPGKLEYQVHDGQIQSIDKVYDSGVELTPIAQYTTESFGYRPPG